MIKLLISNRLPRGRKLVVPLSAAICASLLQPAAAMAQNRQTSVVKLETMAQLCSVRQREILAHNKARIEAGIAYLNTKDSGLKAQHLRIVEASRISATEAEVSWQRLSCLDVLSRPLPPSGR